MIPRPHEEEIDFEPEEDLGSVASLQAKLKKLREELAETKKERQEFLDGWQRCKADVANGAREANERIRRAENAGKEDLAEALLPVLDAFDMAMQGDAWESVDKNWRVGIEHIHTTLLRTLQHAGIRAVGEVGEPFNHVFHEAAGEEEGKKNVVLRVLRRGYASGEKIIRPASVIVGAGS